MVGFVQVDPSEIDTSRLGRRGRVSYPIIKGFMEANIKCARLDTEGLDKNPQYLRSVLTSYVKNHNMPIKIFSAQGDLHMMRLDLDNDGNPLEDWEQELTTTEGAAGHERDLTPMPITPGEVEKRFQEEKGKYTK